MSSIKLKGSSSGEAIITTASDGSSVILDKKLDLQGNEIILDADNDTTITADSDDQIDFRAGGSDTMHIVGAKVGIGTTTFDTFNNFKVSSDNTTETAISIENTATNGQKWELIGGSGGGSYTGGRFGLYSRTHTNGIWSCVGSKHTALAGGGESGSSFGLDFPGVFFDRVWADYPGMSVMSTGGHGDTNQGEFRMHGTNATYSSYPSASGADFSLSVRIDGSYESGSDRRRKKNISSITNAIDIVKQLDGKKFQLCNSELEAQTHMSKNGYKFGFIAQDVEDIIPEAVKYNEKEDVPRENGYATAYSMDYGSIVALLSNAIKEQQVIIDDLKTRITALESE